MRPAAHLCSGQTAGDGGTQSQGVSLVETAQLPEVWQRPRALTRERGAICLAREQERRLARIGFWGARCGAGDHPSGATLGGFALLCSQMSPPWARPFSMKILLASNPEASTPAM